MFNRLAGGDNCDQREKWSRCSRLTAMRTPPFIYVAVVLGACTTGDAKDPLAPDELARALANPGERSAAVERAVGSPARVLPLLLKWTRVPPPNFDENELNISMA